MEKYFIDVEGCKFLHSIGFNEQTLAEWIDGHLIFKTHQQPENDECSQTMNYSSLGGTPAILISQATEFLDSKGLLILSDSYMEEVDKKVSIAYTYNAVLPDNIQFSNDEPFHSYNELIIDVVKGLRLSYANNKP